MNLTRREILEAALIGYRQQVGRISQQIADIEVELRGGNTTQTRTVHSLTKARITKGTGTRGATQPARSGRKMSAAGRERIRAAQRLRWKNFKAQKKAA